MKRNKNDGKPPIFSHHFSRHFLPCIPFLCPFGGFTSSTLRKQNKTKTWEYEIQSILGIMKNHKKDSQKTNLTIFCQKNSLQTGKITTTFCENLNSPSFIFQNRKFSIIFFHQFFLSFCFPSFCPDRKMETYKAHPRWAHTAVGAEHVVLLLPGLPLRLDHGLQPPALALALALPVPGLRAAGPAGSEGGRHRLLRVGVLPQEVLQRRLQPPLPAAQRMAASGQADPKGRGNRAVSRPGAICKTPACQPGGRRCSILCLGSGRGEVNRATGAQPGQKVQIQPAFKL